MYMRDSEYACVCLCMCKMFMRSDMLLKLWIESRFSSFKFDVFCVYFRFELLVFVSMGKIFTKAANESLGC